MPSISKPVGPAHHKLIELALSVIGIIVGLAGIFVTVLTFPSALNAVGEALAGSGLPDGFRGLAGAATLFMVLLVGVLALAALFFGLTCLTALIFRYYDSPTPLGSAALAVLIAFLVAFSVTSYMYLGSFALVLIIPVCFVPVVFALMWFGEGIRERAAKLGIEI